MNKTITILFSLFLFLALVMTTANAQVRRPSPTPSPTPTPSQEATATAEQQEQPPIEDITKPDDTQNEILKLFERRPVSEPTALSFIAYFVQSAVALGVPANTAILILLLPFLATVNAFARHVVGLPSLEMLVPIAFSVALVSTGITAGVIILITILIASAFSQMILKRIRITQMPRKSLTIMIVSIFVFVALTLSALNGILIVRQLSIFPILIMILLGEKIISVQLSRSLTETVAIVSSTIALGLIGFVLLSSQLIRENLLLYPEIILVLIPVNIMIGRYFGLRLTEIYRFAGLIKNGNN